MNATGMKEIIHPIMNLRSSSMGNNIPVNDNAIKTTPHFIIWMVENFCAKSHRSCDCIDDLVL